MSEEKEWYAQAVIDGCLYEIIFHMVDSESAIVVDKFEIILN